MYSAHLGKVYGHYFQFGALKEAIVCLIFVARLFYCAHSPIATPLNTITITVIYFHYIEALLQRQPSIGSIVRNFSPYYVQQSHERTEILDCFASL
jgi:hypothetical protein